MAEQDPHLDIVDATPPRGVVWRVKVGENTYGPYARTKLIDYLEEGRIGGHTLLSCDNETEFVRAENHPYLRWDFSTPAPRGFNAPKLDEGETAVPVCNFFISGRLLGSDDAFEEVLNICGKFARAGGDMWVLRAKMTLPQLRNKLSAILKKDEQIVIVNATKNRIAWFNLGVQNDIAVRSVWDTDA